MNVFNRQRKTLARLAFVLPIAVAQLASAAPKIEDVFKSTNDNFTADVDPVKIIAIVCIVIVVIALLLVLNKRSQRKATPRALNHRGKLMKEIAKQVHLKPAEVRQLKALADAQEIENPLTLLLCPSVLARAAKERPEKIDRRALTGMVKRMM